MITFILFAMALVLSAYLLYKDYVLGGRYDDVLTVLETPDGRFITVKLTLLASCSVEEKAIKYAKDKALELGIPYVDYKGFCRLF